MYAKGEIQDKIRRLMMSAMGENIFTSFKISNTFPGNNDV